MATLFFPGTQPLLAPLTAMLVVQVTPVSLLASGLDRVVAVVTGVSLAVAFAAVLPLEWWSLGLLIFVSIAIGQALRLRANLIEVAISGMLVLGVGSLSAESAAWQRIAETLVGAAVGIAANLLFPPKVASADAARAIDGLADSISELLNRAADELAELVAEGRDVESAAKDLAGRGPPDHPRRHPPGRFCPPPRRAGPPAQRSRRRYARRGAGSAPGVRGVGALRGRHPLDVPCGGGRDVRTERGSTTRAPTTCSSGSPRPCGNWPPASTRSGSSSATRQARHEPGLRRRASSPRRPRRHAGGTGPARRPGHDRERSRAARTARGRAVDRQTAAARDGSRAAGPTPGSTAPPDPAAADVPRSAPSKRRPTPPEPTPDAETQPLPRLPDDHRDHPHP